MSLRDEAGEVGKENAPLISLTAILKAPALYSEIHWCIYTEAILIKGYSQLITEHDRNTKADLIWEVQRKKERKKKS